MLYQKDTGKLELRWRGPFRIKDYGDSYGRSFILEQLNGKQVRGLFHRDHLRRFVLRTGHLSDSTSAPYLPQEQTLRYSRKKLPAT